MTLATFSRAAVTARSGEQSASILQRKCACGAHTAAGGKCNSCQKENRVLQRKSDPSSQSTLAPPIVHDVLRSSGQPLDTATKAFMEARFGRDFSGVRIHTDQLAAESARQTNALAYTVGNDVVFGAQQYQPVTETGKRLIAHELVHTLQQRSNDTSSTRSVQRLAISGDKQLEAEADRLSDFSVNSAGPSIRDSGAAQVLLQRQQDSAQPAAEGDRTSQGESDDGGFCVRFWLPGVDGKVKWEGIDQATLDQHIRLKPEEGTTLVRANADSSDTLDAIYFGEAFGRRIFKVPDHCTAIVSNSLSIISCCCNLAGMTVASLLGKDARCRDATATEFGVPNDWVPDVANPGQEGGSK